MLYELTLALSLLASEGLSIPAPVQPTDAHRSYQSDFTMDLPIESPPDGPPALPGADQVGHLYVLIAPEELGPAAGSGEESP